MKQELILKLIEMLVGSESNNDETKVDDDVLHKGPERAVVVFANNAVMFGYSKDYVLGDVNIRDAQYCYHYKNAEGKNGFLSLAENGPNDGSKVSPIKTGNTLVQACCIAEATEAAIEKWRNGKWK